ncbi:MAG: hypothetical protein ACLP01_12830 [Solirubrobacteraceae bacterium]
MALALPETAERERHTGLASWEVRGEGAVWERPLGHADLLALGAGAPKGPRLGGHGALSGCSPGRGGRRQRFLPWVHPRKGAPRKGAPGRDPVAALGPCASRLSAA